MSLIVLSIGLFFLFWGAVTVREQNRLDDLGAHWADVPKAIDEGRCPCCQNVDPRGTDHNEGKFWSHFSCHCCGFDSTVHLNKEDELA